MKSLIAALPVNVSVTRTGTREQSKLSNEALAFLDAAAINKPRDLVCLPVERTVLRELESLQVERRQVLDLPPQRQLVIEYQAQQKCCPSCQQISAAAFPLVNITSGIPRLRSSCRPAERWSARTPCSIRRAPGNP